ncbi:MAG: hypothetical protein KAS17_00455 [Victivallaceae bacterium]|nr:hypothetical protein [Victivallaceae bacterium]
MMEKKLFVLEKQARLLKSLNLNINDKIKYNYCIRLALGNSYRRQAKKLLQKGEFYQALKPSIKAVRYAWFKYKISSLFCKVLFYFIKNKIKRF